MGYFSDINAGLKTKYSQYSLYVILVCVTYVV